jgi:hypothetical protein
LWFFAIRRAARRRPPSGSSAALTIGTLPSLSSADGALVRSHALCGSRRRSGLFRPAASKSSLRLVCSAARLLRTRTGNAAFKLSSVLARWLGCLRRNRGRTGLPGRRLVWRRPVRGGRTRFESAPPRPVVFSSSRRTLNAWRSCTRR